MQKKFSCRMRGQAGVWSGALKVCHSELDVILGHKTVLYDAHVESGAKIVDFGGWDMPIHYGSQIEEHHAVRKDQGLFDVSHMTVVDVAGSQAEAFLRYLLANDVAKLPVGKALYSGMLNEKGGVIDDLIVYRLEEGFRVVVNCATREKDLAWMNQQVATFDAQVNERPELAIIAVQGPQAIKTVCDHLPQMSDALQSLKPFTAFSNDDYTIGRTGYTGEDGVEIIVSNHLAADLWRNLVKAGVRPCGLGARDTLRLEAGMNLYGSDMTEATTPLESNMAWTISWSEDRDFIGKHALQDIKDAGVQQKLVGLVLEQKGILRAHQTVITEAGNGEITSGSFSPTLGYSVALARVPRSANGNCEVEMRGKRFPVKLVKPPFVRNGARVYE